MRHIETTNGEVFLSQDDHKNKQEVKIMNFSASLTLKLLTFILLLILMSIQVSKADHHTLECNCVKYARTLADGISYGLTYYDAKKKIATKSTPKVGYSVIMNTAQPYGHIAVVTKVDSKYIYVKHANFTACKITSDKFLIKDKRIYGYVPSTLKSNVSVDNSNEAKENATVSDREKKRACKLKVKYKKKALYYKNKSIKYHKKWLKSKKSSDLRRNQKYWKKHEKYVRRYNKNKKICP